jgi:predicted nuclease with TOPRIM domain
MTENNNITLPTTGDAIAHQLGCGVGAVQKRFEAIRLNRHPARNWSDVWKWNPANPLPLDVPKEILRSFLGDYHHIILPLLTQNEPLSNVAKRYFDTKQALETTQTAFANLEKRFANLVKDYREANGEKESVLAVLRKRENEYADLMKDRNEWFDAANRNKTAFANLEKRNSDFAELEKRFAELGKANQLLSQNGKTNDVTFAEMGKLKTDFADLEKRFAELGKERDRFANFAKDGDIAFAELGKLKLAFADLGKENERLSQIRKSDGEAFDKLAKDYADLKTAFADLENGNLSFAEMAKGETNGMIAELESYKASEATNRKQLKDNEIEIRSLLEKTRHLGHENQTLRERNGKLQTETEKLNEFRKKYVELKQEYDLGKMAKAEQSSVQTAFARRYGSLVGTLSELSGSFRILLGVTESICFYGVFERLDFTWWVSGGLSVVLALIFQGKLLVTALAAAADVTVNGLKNWALDGFAIVMVTVLIVLGIQISSETRQSVRNLYPVSIVDSVKFRVVQLRYQDSTNTITDKFKSDTNSAGNTYRSLIGSSKRIIDKWSTQEDIDYTNTLNRKDSLIFANRISDAERRKINRIAHFKAAYETECKAIPNIIRNDYGAIIFGLDMIALLFIALSALALAIYEKETCESPRIESIPMRIWAKWSGEFWKRIEKMFKI